MSVPDYDQAFAAAREPAPFSNGTEYECWTTNWCDRCINDQNLRAGQGAGCPLPLVALEGRTPAEWTPDKPGHLGEQYRCIYFRSEDDGPDPEPQPIPDPPDQLTLVPREPFEATRMLTSYPQPALTRTP